jgi:hypothetical protein
MRKISAASVQLARYVRELMIMVWKWNSIPLPTTSPSQKFIDVGAPLASHDPAAPMYTFWVGKDNTLWRLQANGGGGAWLPISVPPSSGLGPITRVAVAPDNTAWCIKDYPAAEAYYLPKGLDNGWKSVSLSGEEGIQQRDVCVAKDSSIWIVSTNTQQWVSSDLLHHFSFEMELIALAGLTAPVASSNLGGAWGIIGNPSRPASGGTIALCKGRWYQTPPQGGVYISGVVDISTSPNHLWMVTTEGIVLSSPDGINGIQMGDPSFRAQRITGGYVSEPNGEIVYCVGQDGLPYVWADG